MRRGVIFQAPSGFRDSPTPPLKHGEVVASTYSIREEIARTETGIVFEARDMMLDRLVALKLAWRDAGQPSLLVEARRCAAVRDPCAAAIYGMGNHQGVEYVVGERIAGRSLGERLMAPLTAPDYLAKFRTLVAAVVRAHEGWIAVGEVSGATVLVDATGRMVLGRLSLSQVPSLGPLGELPAPEIVRGEVEATDPAAAEAIDLYGLGCLAIELACGKRPFTNTDPTVELQGHAYRPAPRIVELRPDLPEELSDLVEWLVEKRPAARPRSAFDVLAQLDAIIERFDAVPRSLRVLVVDDDPARGRWLWSVARRAHAAAQVEIASNGNEAAHKLNRDVPDLVLVRSALRGVMNAFELCMYARGLEDTSRGELCLIGQVAPADQPLFDAANVPFIAEGPDLPNAVLDRVRRAVTERPRPRKPRTTISG